MIRDVYKKLHGNSYYFIDYDIAKLIPNQTIYNLSMNWAHKSNISLITNLTSDKTKNILLWTTFFGDETWSIKDLRQNPLKNCKYSSCAISTDKTHLSISDAVIFHLRDMQFRELPFNHSYNQIWIFFMMESPILTCYNEPEIPYQLDKYDYVFNWTITYLPQSDINKPYYTYLGIDIKKSTSNHSKNYEMYSKNKKKLAISVMSNCASFNHRLVIGTGPTRSLEVYGRCSNRFSGSGSRICDSEGHAKDCLENFISNYKFYLAFENANCAHYITEKMFRALHAGVVPIVFGARYSEYVKIAPPFSFIYIASPLAMKTNEVVGNISSQKDPSIRDINQEVPKNHPYFHSNNLEEVANYLLKLDSDDKLYDKYHAWRKEYEIVPRLDDEYLCQICKHLHIKDIPNKSYKISVWWNKERDCNPYQYE
ncbi:unnamed protein product [Gordionus sp. m RMFG-2023]